MEISFLTKFKDKFKANIIKYLQDDNVLGSTFENITVFEPFEHSSEMVRPCVNVKKTIITTKQGAKSPIPFTCNIVMELYLDHETSDDIIGNFMELLLRTPKSPHDAPCFVVGSLTLDQTEQHTEKQLNILTFFIQYPR